MFKRLISELYNYQGNKFFDQQKYLNAEKKFRQAAKHNPSWAVPWYNLGLLYKRQRRWQESLTCNTHAVTLNEKDEAAWWNLGIAATALGNWSEARRAWKAYGLDVSSGDQVLEMNLGPVPIRIESENSTEVVWTFRLDPARARIESIPFSASGHRYGDIVLHDGVPNGYRKRGDIEVPVFDEIEIIIPSQYSTYEVHVDVNDSQSIEEFLALSEGQDVTIENWSADRVMCKLCSEGKPHEHHEPEQSFEQPIRFGVAAKSDSLVQSLLDKWSEREVTRKISYFDCVLRA